MIVACNIWQINSLRWRVLKQIQRKFIGNIQNNDRDKKFLKHFLKVTGVHKLKLRKIINRLSKTNWSRHTRVC